MAVQNEVIKLLLQFETAFTDPSAFKNFVSSSESGLKQIQAAGDSVVSSVGLAAAGLLKLKNITGSFKTDDLKKLAAEGGIFEPLIKSSKELNAALNDLRQTFFKSIDVSNIVQAGQKIQETFIPNKGNQTKFGEAFVKNFNEQIQSLATGKTVSIQQFFDQLIPTEGFAKKGTQAVETVKRILSDLNIAVEDLNKPVTTALAQSVLEKIAEKLDVGKIKLKDTTAEIKLADQELKKVISDIVKIASEFLTLGIQPPKELFGNFSSEIKKQANNEKAILGTVIKELLESLGKNPDVQIPPINIARFLQNMGFSESGITKYFNELDSKVTEKLKNLTSNLTSGGEGLKTQLEKVQSFLTKSFDTSSFTGFGKSFDDAFANAATTLKAFENAESVSLKTFNEFQTGLSALRASLNEQVGKSPLALELQNLLTAYQEVAGRFRLGQLLQDQIGQVNAFQKQVDFLKNTIATKVTETPQPIKFLTSENAGVEAFKQKAEALEQFNALTVTTEARIKQLQNTVETLGLIRTLTVDPKQISDIDILIERYKGLKTTLEEQKTILATSQADWSKAFDSKIKDVNGAKEAVKNLMNVLGSTNADSGSILKQTAFLKGFLDIALSSDKAAEKLKPALALLSNFGGISTDSAQAILLFEKAISTLFKSIGEGKDRVTLLDLSKLIQQSDGTYRATEALQKQILSLAGSSAVAREQFDQLALAADFLSKTGLSDSTFGKQISTLLDLAQASRNYLTTLDLQTDRLKAYQETLSKVADAQNSVKERLATAGMASEDNRTVSVNELQSAYDKLSREIAKAELQLKQLQETEKGLVAQKATLGIDDGGQLKILQVNIALAEKEIGRLKTAFETLRAGDTQNILEGVIKGVEQGRSQLKSTFDALERDLSGRLLQITEKLNTNLSKGSIGKGLFDQIQGEISNLSVALKTVNVDGALQAIQALVAKIQTALDPKNVPVNKELAQTYLAPIKELLNGLEVAQGAIARIIPKLGEGQKGKAEELLKNVQTQIIATNTVLNDFGKTANTAQLTTRFEEAKLKARELNAEISRLGKGSFDQTKYNDFELRLQGINNQYKAISKENEAFGAGLRISELNNLIDTASRSLKDFGKATNFDILNNQLIALRDKFPTLNADIANFDKLLREAFAGTKTSINIKPLIDLKNEVQDVKNNLKNPAQNNLYTSLLTQLDALINKTTIYNATVKAGSSKADVGVQAFIDPTSVNNSKASLQALEAELNNNKLALDTFIKSSGQTKETATQIAESFKVTRNSVHSLTAEIGALSGVSSSLLSHINALKAGGADTSAFEKFRASIEAIIKTKKDLDAQFKGGNLTGKLKEDLDRLVDVKDALAQFKTVGESFKSAAFFDSTSYSARQAYEEIQRLESAMRKISGDINKSLSVGRTEPINPAIKTELESQQKSADAAIIKLQQIGQAYDQLRSKSKIEIFEQLKNTFENITGNGRTELQAYKTEFETTISGVTASIASLKVGVAPLTQTLVDSFKQQSESIAATRTQYEEFLKILRSFGTAGYTKFKFADGSEIGIGRLIVTLKNLLEQANAVKAPIEQASNELKDRLGTATGQAELRISNLITKFTQLQDRINTINPGSSINEIYGSVKELMMLLNQPYKTGPFFTLPKEGFAPIRNELQSILEVAKNVQTGLQFNLTALTPGTKNYKDTELQIKAAREEVERLTAASQKLSEFEKNASHFSALRGNLHGASTTLQELAHEGAFIYKGLEALFKNLAKNLTGPAVTINTSTLNQQLDQLTTKFGVTGTAADHLKAQVKEALNQQLGGGGLAAAEQFQKAFQQLEEAFVKFRSGLTQAAMGFQMLGDSLLEPFKKAKEHFEQFSDTMGVVNAATNATQAQFEALTNKALLMGATTRFTAEQAAEGLVQLAKAGFTAEQQLASLPTVMRLAQAAATDLGVAAGIATVVMNEFRMNPEQFNQAADVITLAANRTLGTVEDLGYSFKYVGALAANIGADFGELTAAIGLLHNAGLKGTLSGTALRGMLMALYNPTRDETKLIAELGERIGGLGLQIQDASGNFVGYGKIVKQLEQAGITTGEVLRFFGQRAGPGMAALLAQGSEALQNLEKDLKNAEGTTAHMAEIMEQTLKGRLLLMRSAFEALSDSIGHNLAPTLAAAANVMAEFVSRFVAVRQEFPALATAVDHVLAGFALFASVLGGLAVTFAFIIVPVRQFMGFLKTLIVTTLAGAASITSLSAAQAFNAKVTAATMVAVEAEFRARIAQAAATGVATTAINYNTIAAGINVVAIREQTAALLGATAAAGANAAAQTGLWVGLKNVILGLGRNLLNIGGMLRFAFLSPLGLVLTAVTGVVAYTLLHEKSVAQTNVELDKQSQIIEYSRKNIVKLNEELLSSAEQLKRNQQALNELRSGDGPERDLLGQKDQSQTTEANLQLDIDKGKKEIQKQLKELFTQITESSTYKDLVNFKIEFDAGGAFKQFTTVLKDGNKEFEILGDNLEFNTDQLKDFTKALDETASARQRSNAEEKIANELSKITQEKLSKENFGQFGSQFRNPFAFDTNFEESSRRISDLTKNIKHYSDQIEKLKKGASLKDVGFSFTTLDLFKTPSNEEAIKRLEALRIGLNDELAKLNVTTNSQVGEFVDYFVKTVPEMLGKGLDEIAVQNADNPEIIRNILEGIFNLRNFDRAAFDPVYAAIQAELNDRNKNLTTEQLVGENLKKPVIGLVNATKDLVTYLEATNKELKTKIDEQKKIFDEAKVVVDAVKAYQTAIAAAAKDTLDVRNQEIEFEAKIETENLDRSFEEQLRTLEDANRVIELPFKAKLITETADTSGFKALSGLSGLLLDYEKKNTAEFVKIQSTNSERIKKIKLAELNDKQAATEQYYQTLKDHYSVDSADYLKAQQEQASATKENLDSRLEAVQDHLKDLLKLYQDNAKAIIDLEKQKKQFQAVIEQTKVNFGNAQLLPTEQLQKTKFDLSTLDAQIQGLLKEEKFDDAIARLNEYQKLVDQIATSAGAQPELTLKVANLAENLEFDLDRIDFEKEFNKANLRITMGAKGLGDAFSSTFTKFKPLSSSFVPQLESGAVDVKKALQTVVRVYGEEVDKLKKKDAEGFQGLGEGISTLQYASSGILKSFGKSFDDNLRFKKAQNELENFGDMMENAFNVRPVTDLVKGVNDLDTRLSQVTQAQNALNEFGIPGESASAVPLLSNISETGEKGIVTLRNVKGEMIALSLQAKTEIKPLEGLTTDIQKGKEALVGFKALIDTQIEDLSRSDKVVELPISFKADFNAFDTSSLASYSAEVLSYEKNLNEEVLHLQLQRINATLDQEKEAAEKKKTVVENQISTIETLYDKQLGEMQNWSKQDLDAYKSNIESKKSSLISFLQEELSATQSTYNELFQIRANLLNKNRALDEQYISFQANATKNFQTIDDLGKSDSQKTYETRLKSLNIQADADAALAQGDYDRAKALLEQRQQLIDAAVNSLKPEDTLGKFFLKQDQTEAVESYKKVTDALKVQNQSAVKEVEAQLNSVNGQILALKQSADTAKAALQDLLNKLFELSTKKFQAEVEVIQKNTQQAENLGEQAYSGAIAQRKDIGKTLLQDREKVKKEEQGLIKLYQQQVVELRKIIDIIKEKQLVKIGIDPDAYEEVLAYAKFYLDTMDAISKDQVETQLAKTKLTDLENQYKELQKLKQANQELLVVQKQLEQVTATQKQLGGLVGFSNTITTATSSAKSLADVFTTLEDKETGLNTEELASANKILEALRKSSQGVREDFKKIEVDETVQNRLAEIFGLFETDVSKLKGEELKGFVSQMTTALKDLEGFQRDVNTKIAGEAKNTALSTIAEVQASVLKIEGILKDAKIAPEVKDISLKEIRKQLEDQLKNLQITIDTADKSGNQEQIAALAPLKDLLLEVNKITKSNLSDEDKITRLLNIKNTLAQKQKELTIEQMESARRASEVAEKQKRIQEQNLNTSKAQSIAAQDTAKAQESIAQAADKTDKVWAKTTLKDQSIALNAVQGMIDEINQTGFYLVKPEDQDSITKLFNQLKDAQANLNQAIQSGDTAAITKAITEIKELGIQFKNTAGLSDAARQKFSELANIPSIDVAIKANTSSIPPAKQAVKELQDQAKQDTSVTMSTEEVALAVTKLKDVENEVTKLRRLSAVELKGYTTIDVEKSRLVLETFAQRAKALLEVPISARDEEFKAKLRALLVDYDQFRSQLQPIKIEGEANSFNETYQKALSTLQNLRDQATLVGATEQAQKYSEILNKVLQARLDIQSNDINIRTQGYENLKTLIDGTQELKTALTEADKKSLNIKITTVGKDVVLSDIASIGTELDNTKNKARSLDATLKEVRSGLSETATVPGLETPAAAFDELNNKLTDTRTRLKDAFAKGDLNTDGLNTFKNNIQNLIDKMSQVKGVTPDMVKALREAVDVELKDYTVKVIPEIQPMEERAEPTPIELAPEPLEIPTPPPVTILTEVEPLAPVELESPTVTVTALVDQAVSGIGQVLSMLNALPSSRTVVINTVYRTSGSPPTQNRNQGGLIGSLQYFAEGGLTKFKELASAFVPGIGNTDTVPAMLTPGEFVIKKERVKSLGIGFLNALNNGLLQFKAAGGMVYNSPINTLNKMSDYVKPNYQIPQQAQSAGGPPIDINLTIKDKTFSIKTPRDEAKKLVSALQYLERGITKK